MDAEQAVAGGAVANRAVGLDVGLLLAGIRYVHGGIAKRAGYPLSVIRDLQLSATFGALCCVECEIMEKELPFAIVPTANR